MANGREARLVDRLQDRYGDALRAVATYDQDDYELLYVGTAAAENYSATDREEIHEDVILEELMVPQDEQLFDDMGDIRGKVRVFDEGLVVHFWPASDDETGLFVGFDGSADPRIATLYHIFETTYDSGSTEPTAHASS